MPYTYPGRKQREARRAVMMPARMRSDAAWDDVCIRNVSSRGLLIRSEQPPEPGSYIEIRRANETLVGRTMWRLGKECGVRMQDSIDVGAMTGVGKTAGSAPGEPPVLKMQRRSATRSAAEVAQSAERSGWLSSLFQYLLLALLGVAAAGFAAVAVNHFLGRPFGIISAHLFPG